MVNRQPEALRLADDLEVTDGLFMESQAAAELRRLHVENDVLKFKLHASRRASLDQKERGDELLEALRSVWLWMEDQADGQSKGGHATFDLMLLKEQRDIARAAIVKATGETK